MANGIKDLAVTVTEQGHIAVTRMTERDAITDVLSKEQAQYLRDELSAAITEANGDNRQ